MGHHKSTISTLAIKGDLYAVLDDFWQFIKNAFLTILLIVAIGFALFLLVVFVIIPLYHKLKDKSYYNTLPAKYKRYSREDLINIRKRLISYQNAKNKVEKEKYTHFRNKDDAIDNLDAQLACSTFSDEMRKDYGLTFDKVELDIKYLNSIL